MKKSIRLQTNSEAETDFVFSVNDKLSIEKLDWEDDDEFNLNGEMYDVIEKKVEGSKLIIRCLADKKETALLNKLDDHWKENDKSNKIANELFQLLQTLFHHSGSEGVAFIEITEYDRHLPLKKLPFGIIKIPTPPPQG